MAAERAELPLEMRHFAQYLNSVVPVIDRDGTWFREFRQRDPEGMRACLEGREVPPWDVVVSLLQDLAAIHGLDAARREEVRVRVLYNASIRAQDRTEGGQALLGERLRLLRREQQQAAQRLREIEEFRAGSHGAGHVAAVESELAWAHDYYTRIRSRVAELRGRLAALEQSRTERVGPASWDPWHVPSPPDNPGVPSAEAAPPATAEPEAAPKRRRRGSARFAGVDFDDGASPAPRAAAPSSTPSPRGARFSGAPATAAPSAATLAPEPHEAAAAPRGARFAGAATAAATPAAPVVDDGDRAAVTHTVDLLRRLRTEGRGGAAHAVLVEAARGPAARLPLLARRLEQAGMATDWATLLWEAAALPPDLVLAAANALAATDRPADGEQLLRQGMARPTADIGAAVVDLTTQGRRTDARAVADAYLRTRSPSEAAQVARSHPALLVPLLLDAALAIAADLHDELLVALRIAGVDTDVEPLT